MRRAAAHGLFSLGLVEPARDDQYGVGDDAVFVDKWLWIYV
jgi:hypothetical protein